MGTQKVSFVSGGRNASAFEAVLEAGIPGFKKGEALRGHEFHYSTILDQPDAPLAAVSDANGDPVPETGSVRGSVTGTFFHLIAGEGGS